MSPEISDKPQRLQKLPSGSQIFLWSNFKGAVAGGGRERETFYM